MAVHLSRRLPGSLAANRGRLYNDCAGPPQMTTRPHPLGARPRPISLRMKIASGDPNDLSGLQALRAHSHAPRLVVHEDLGNLQIGQPPALGARGAEFPGPAVRVSYVLAVLRPLCAKMTSLSQSWHLLSAGLATLHLTTVGA
jgi:hypothetical protein